MWSFPAGFGKPSHLIHHLLRNSNRKYGKLLGSRTLPRIVSKVLGGMDSKIVLRETSTNESSVLVMYDQYDAIYVYKYIYIYDYICDVPEYTSYV